MLNNKESWEKFGQLAISFGGYLISEQFYYKLDNLDSFREFFEYCKSLESMERGQALKIYCAKILKYLKSNSEHIDKQDTYNVCELLNYWLATRLSAIVGYMNHTYVINVFLEISYIWNDFIMNNFNNNHHKICNPKVDMISLSDWRKRKEVYDYFVDYAYLSGMSRILVNPSDYCTHIRNKISIYNYFNDKCASDQTGFCDEFKTKYKACSPYDLLLRFKCSEEVEKNKSSGEIEERELHKRASLGKEKSEQERQSPRFSIEGKQTVKILQSSYNSFIPLKKVCGLILGIVAISMIYGFLHKFTQLGSWIRNKIANKKNNRSNINFEFNEEFDYEQGLDNTNYNIRNEHYIGFHTD
ncbi:variable surface protein [Plasmodium gonderi]|uniref:Variable surface protein n=1 Tax=Plasmodium gonderi TaxID=77519 RepID=A0A1Y1JPP8_PLAGO|nr:variable surface protein [Plasmodium gonderi]GAW84596.1 variable surface protein [Plasmodium gonderi]